MKEERKDEHTILMVDEPPQRTGYSQVYDPTYEAPPYTQCATTGFYGPTSQAKPVDRGYYRRTFGSRK